jgi:hypothetical protein
MRVLWDRGLHRYAQVRATRDWGAHCLGRVSTSVSLTLEEELPDGSCLTTRSSSPDARRTPPSSNVASPPAIPNAPNMPTHPNHAPSPTPSPSYDAKLHGIGVSSHVYNQLSPCDE